MTSTLCPTKPPAGPAAIFDVATLVNGASEPILVWEAVIGTAVAHRVSDIHLMAQKEGYDLAFRVDGDVLPQGRFRHDFARRLIGHVRSVAGMDLAEMRRPTEGRMKAPFDDKTVDIRISVVPTLYGQDMVVRLFDGTVSLMDMTDLGMERDQLETVRDMMARPSGLILVAGPSGGGKSTTLYAMLTELARRRQKIVTIEDPVEYDLSGVNQTQVNPRIGVSFAMLLTAILRQDPDIIMVGEIRDPETAATAVRAANTGHLVLATTHATRASRAIETMLGLGVHPYFLSVALRCLIAQVLVKTICPHCKTPLPATAEMLLEENVRRRLPEGVQPHLWHGAGCDRCRHTGYSGRIGMFEVLVVDDTIKRLMVERRAAAEIDQSPAAQRMLSLEQAGKLLAVTGKTTLEEVVDTLPLL